MKGDVMLGFYRKWIKGECRHLCFRCKHKAECLTQLAEEDKIKQESEVITAEDKTLYTDNEKKYLPSEFYSHTLDRFNNVH